jgi:hypothetical protein
MYLSNDMYQDGVCNGTVSIVTHVDVDSKLFKLHLLDRMLSLMLSLH